MTRQINSSGRALARSPLAVFFRRFWLIALILVGWAATSLLTVGFYFPKLAETLRSITFFLNFAGLQEHVLPTVSNMLVGFTIACVAGVTLGIVIGSSQLLYELISPAISFLRSVPPPALLPIAVVLLGLGPQMRIGLIAFGAVWPTLLATIDAVRNQDPGLLDMAKVYSVRPWRRLVQIVVPASSPMIIAGARTSLLYSITLIVLSEMVGASSGLGFSVLLAQRAFRFADMWAAILVLGLIGLILNVLFSALERKLLRWHQVKFSGGEKSWAN